MVKITLPWENYNGPFGAFAFTASEAFTDLPIGDPQITRLHGCLGEIKVEDVKPGSPTKLRIKAAPKPLPAAFKNRPKPLPLKKAPAPKSNEEEEDMDVDEELSAQARKNPAKSKENESFDDDDDMVAVDIAPRSTGTEPSEAEMALAKKQVKKLGKGFTIAPRVATGGQK